MVHGGGTYSYIHRLYVDSNHIVLCTYINNIHIFEVRIIEFPTHN